MILVSSVHILGNRLTNSRLPRLLLFSTAINSFKKIVLVLSAVDRYLAPH